MMHAVAQSIAKNTTIMMASQVITWMSSFVLMMVLPRYLGSEEYGRLYLAISLTMMLQMVIDFGGSYFIAKEVSRVRDRAMALISNSIVFRVTLWAAALIVVLLFCLFVSYSDKVIALVAILGFAKVWEVSTKVFNSGFQGFEMMEYTSFGAVAERVFVAVASVSALMLGADAVVIAVLIAVSTLLNFSVVTRFARRTFFSGTAPIRWETIRALLKEGFPYFLYSIFAVMYYRIGAVMLSLMTTDAVVGWYGAAFRFFDVLMFLPSILSFAVFPVLARLQGTSQETLSRVTRKSLDIVIMAGIPVTVLCVTFSREIIAMFFGIAEYGPSVLLLQIFSIGLLLVYIDFVLGTTLFATDRQRQWTMVAFAALLLNPVLNYVLIPVTQQSYGNGAIGAALATLATELFVMMLAIAIMPKTVFAGASVRTQLKGLGAGIVMAVAVALMAPTDLPWVLQSVLGLVLYVALIILFRAFEPVETEFILRFFTLQNFKKIFVPQRGANA